MDLMFSEFDTYLVLKFKIHLPVYVFQ